MGVASNEVSVTPADPFAISAAMISLPDAMLHTKARKLRKQSYNSALVSVQPGPVLGSCSLSDRKEVDKGGLKLTRI